MKFRGAYATCQVIISVLTSMTKGDIVEYVVINIKAGAGYRY